MNLLLAALAWVWFCCMLICAAGFAFTRADKLEEDGAAPPMWLYFLAALVLSFALPFFIVWWQASAWWRSRKGAMQ